MPIRFSTAGDNVKGIYNKGKLGKGRSLFFVFYFVLFLHSGSSFAFDTDKIPAEGLPLGGQAEFWVDSEGGTDFAEVLKKKDDFKPVLSPYFGYGSSVYWFRIRVENETSLPVSWVLEIQYPYLDRIELYRSSSGMDPVYRAGDSVPFRERPLFYRNPSFPLEVSGRSQDSIFIRVQTTSAMNFTALAYKRKDFFTKANSEQILEGLYFGAILVLVFYNLFLFLSTKERVYFSFSSYVGTGIFLQWILHGYGFQYLWPEATVWASQCIAPLGLLSIAAAADFGRRYFDARSRNPRIHALVLGLIFFSLASAFVSAFLPIRFGMALYFPVVFFGLVCLILLGVQNLSRNVRSTSFFLGAWLVFLFGVFLYGLKFSGFLSRTVWVASWGIELGSLFHVLLIGMSLADRVNELSKDLTNRVDELAAAKHSIEQSEMRFRNLFEGAQELLLTLDKEGKVRDANRTLSRLTGYRPSEIQGKSFLDLIYSPEGPDGSLNIYLAKEKLEEHLKLRKTVDFHSEFSQKYVMEPRPVKIRLQSFDTEGERMVLGKVSEISEDILSRFLQSESMHFTVNNYLRNADILSRQLTSNLGQFTGSEVVTVVRTCLREVLINAIEHGNLGISFDEKTDAIKAGNYMEFIQKRQKEIFYGSRSVKVAYSLNSNRIGFEIYDEGDGFDFKKVLNMDGEKLNQESYTHGRGIMMTRRVFDVVKFNEKGNRVLLIKYLQKPLKYKREPSSFDI